MHAQENAVESKLIKVLDEVAAQQAVGNSFTVGQMPFIDEVAQIRDWIIRHGEYGIAYESLVAMLEQFNFVLTGPTAVMLLEIGLSMRFKTDREQDSQFDSRQVNQENHNVQVDSKSVSHKS